VAGNVLCPVTRAPTDQQESRGEQDYRPLFPLAKPYSPFPAHATATPPTRKPASQQTVGTATNILTGQRSARNSPYKPARCKLGRHTLGHSEFRAVVQDGEARVSCLACATDSADHFWRLVATAPVPDLAELSEKLYFELVLRRSQAARTPGDGRRA
jgi:hypothetical protein